MKNVVLLIIGIFLGGLLSAQNNPPKEISMLRKKIDEKIQLKDSFLRCGEHKRAYKCILSADSLRLRLQEATYKEQNKNLQLMLQLQERNQENKILQLRRDSLALRNHIAQTQSNEAKLAKEKVDRILRTQKVKQRYEEERLKTNLTKEKNAEIQHELQNERRLDRNWIAVGLIVILGLISILLSMRFLFHKRALYVRELKKQKSEADASKMKAEKAKEEAETARLEAEKANAMKTVFIQNMSHEIRTPLNAIVGFSGVLTDKTMKLDEAGKLEFSSMIEKNSEMLTTLINDILDLSNLISGQYKMKYSETTVQDIGYTALRTVEHRAPRGVDMSFDIPQGEENLTLWTDGGRVEQVLINYFTNACKNTTQGSIKLSYSIIRKPHSHKPIFVRFSVTDTGIGVPQEKAETIFKRFEKLDDFKQGNGLGLNICRTIAERLNATCWLDSTYHSGARFYFEIPVLTEQPET